MPIRPLAVDVDGDLSNILRLGDIKLVHDTEFRILGRLALAVLLAALTLTGCGDDSRPPNGDPPQPVDGNPPAPVDQEVLDRMAAELEGRSFRQFHPSLDASLRRGVILDFYDGLSLWAQYAEDGHAIYEWEITADGYRVESTADGSGIVLIPENVKSERWFPDPCVDCVPAAGVSISISDVLDADEIAFRIDDPDSVLTVPFPVFDSWTRFREDKAYD